MVMNFIIKTIIFLYLFFDINKYLYIFIFKFLVAIPGHCAGLSCRKTPRHHRYRVQYKESILMKNYLSSKEAAAFLGISINTLYSLTQKKKIKFYKPGGKVLYFQEHDLKDFVTSGKEVLCK